VHTTRSMRALQELDPTALSVRRESMACSASVLPTIRENRLPRAKATDLVNGWKSSLLFRSHSVATCVVLTGCPKPALGFLVARV
jgi:hypothetical protein